MFFSAREREKKKIRDQKALEKKRARLEDNANKVKGPAWTGMNSPPLPFPSLLSPCLMRYEFTLSTIL